MNESNLSRRQFMLSAMAGIGTAAVCGASAAVSKDGGAKTFPSMEAAVKEAWRLVENEGACRVLVRGNAIVSVERGRGPGPLLRLFDAEPGLLEGAVMVESVMGRAAAAVAVKGGVGKVFARTASEGARDILSAAGVPLEAKVMVPRIMNRDLTGVCPVERAAAGLESPAAVIAAARRTLVSLHGGGKGVVA